MSTKMTAAEAAIALAAAHTAYDKAKKLTAGLQLDYDTKLADTVAKKAAYDADPGTDDSVDPKKTLKAAWEKAKKLSDAADKLLQTAKTDEAAAKQAYEKAIDDNKAANANPLLLIGIIVAALVLVLVALYAGSLGGDKITQSMHDLFSQLLTSRFASAFLLPALIGLVVVLVTNNELTWRGKEIPYTYAIGIGVVTAVVLMLARNWWDWTSTFMFVVLPVCATLKIVQPDPTNPKKWALWERITLCVVVGLLGLMTKFSIFP